MTVAYERRNRDLDPQLVWRGKDEQDADERLTVAAPPLFTQEKVHPKALIDDLVREAQARRNNDGGDDDVIPRQPALDLFADFNGLHDANARTEFYQHDINWANRLILGDSLQVMASPAEREGLRWNGPGEKTAAAKEYRRAFPPVRLAEIAPGLPGNASRLQF